MATTDLPLASPDDINPADETVAGSARQVVDASSATVSMSAVNAVNADTVSAAASAIATAKTGSLDATGCAVGLAQVDGNATISLSAAPIVSAKGDATFRQAYASAFISGGDVSISQGGAPLIIGREITIDTGAAAVARRKRRQGPPRVGRAAVRAPRRRGRGLPRAAGHEGRADTGSGAARRVRPRSRRPVPLGQTGLRVAPRVADLDAPRRLKLGLRCFGDQRDRREVAPILLACGRELAEHESGRVLGHLDLENDRREPR